MGLQDNFYATVLFIAEGLVSGGGFLKWDPVSDDERRVNDARLDFLQ